MNFTSNTFRKSNYYEQFFSPSFCPCFSIQFKQNVLYSKKHQVSNCIVKKRSSQNLLHSVNYKFFMLYCTPVFSPYHGDLSKQSKFELVCQKKSSHAFKFSKLYGLQVYILPLYDYEGKILQ